MTNHKRHNHSFGWNFELIALLLNCMEIAGGDRENISLCANKVHAHSPFCLCSHYEEKFFVREANLVIGQMSFHAVMLQN